MDVFEVSVPAGTSATMALPDPYLINYYEQLENRTLWLDKELSDEGIEIVKKIMRWNSEDEDRNLTIEERQPIRLMLFSPGGDVYAMLAIMDAILLSKTPVYTCVVSLAASAACGILIAGHKRFCLPHGHGMWHSGSASVAGQTGQVQAATKHLDGIEDQLGAILLERTKVSSRMLKKQRDKDWYLNATELLEYGFVDKIVESIDEII